MMEQGGRRPLVELLEPPDWRQFYEQYVRSSQPVVLRGAARKLPAFSKWTDEYLKQQWGAKRIQVELNKTETRGGPSEEMSFTRFLDEMYKKERDGQLYAIVDFDTDRKAHGDVKLPDTIACKEVMPQSVTLWISSGGTSSVLHSDDAENFLMMLDGRKQVMLVHPDQAQNMYAPIAEVRGSSPVHQSVVDMVAFPRFANVTWIYGEMSAGDVLYIPHSYWHQVNSFGRNLGLNIWWQHSDDWRWWDPSNPKEWDVTRFGDAAWPSFDSLKGRSRPLVPCTPLPEDHDLTQAKFMPEDKFKRYAAKKRAKARKAGEL